MDEKKKILKSIYKHNERQYINKKQIKAKKKKWRKARNHLLDIENGMCDPFEKKDKRVSEWESSFWRNHLIEAQETIKNLTVEITRYKEDFKNIEQDFKKSQEEKNRYAEIAKTHSLRIKTLKQIAKKNKDGSDNISESSFVLKNKINDLSAELRQQRAKNRQLKSELISFQEIAENNAGDNGMSLVSGVVNIKITKGTEQPYHRKTKGKNFNPKCL